MSEFYTRFVVEADRIEWRDLFQGYADFYETPMTDAIADRVWNWLLDPAHVLEGIVVCNANDNVVGFVHIRSCPRSLGGCDVGFLDDMFVAPSARGSGAADALFAALKQLAAGCGWPSIRWITQHFNYRGRSFYDRYTNGPSEFVLYQWKPQ